MSTQPDSEDLLAFRLETGRLLLAPIEMDYADVIFDEFTDEVTQYMYPATPRRVQETETFIRESLIAMERGANLQLVILRRETGEFLGCTGIHNLDSRFPELGIWLKISAHRHGFGMETIAALKEWAEEHLEYEYLKYPVDERNYPSRRIPEALGGLPERTYWMKNQSGMELEIVEYRFYPPERD